jgi:murein DD-endopeptidase MepM/ murein hydrolase activator NlpD
VRDNARLVLVRASIGLALAVALLTAGAVRAAAPSQAGATARAFALRIIVPGQPGLATTTVGAPPDQVQFSGGASYPADGSLLAAGSYTASASAGGGQSAYANASSEVTSVSLFGGEVTASAVVARAKATARPGKASGDLSGTGISSFTVLGQGVGVGANARVALGDWGYATTLEQGVEATEDGYRGFVTALDIVLTADHGGFPAGTQIQIGHVEVAAQAPPAPPVPKPTPGPKPSAQRPAGTKARTPPEPEQGFPGLPSRVAPRRAAPDLIPRLTAGGYVFPVYGPVSFSDTFQAPRAGVGWHHGEDIFAPLGAPILAVAKGTVYSVGWNDLGGNRLWLRDAEGNQFYYAHLSAFTPLAVNNAHVNAGDVLGFVGNTGDAQSTPYHLHFEIHPVELLYLGYDGVVAPYQFLLKWQHLEDLRFGAAGGWAPSAAPRARAPQAGAILLQASDISTANGLEPSSLRRAFAPVSAESDGALLGLVRPRPAPAGTAADRPPPRG